jgi:uncharacterized protein YndB with AHSA1/START domain
VAPQHCSVRLTRRYRAPAAEVWRALTDPESLARWLGRPNDVQLEAGGSFVLELPEGGRVAGRVRELEPERVLELDWSLPGEDVSLVRFELREEDDRTVLVLDHSQVEEVHGMAYMARWTRLLERLEEELRP